MRTTSVAISGRPALTSAAVEQWRDIPRYRGFYQASDRGRIRSVDRDFADKLGRKWRSRGRVRQPHDDGTGYLRIDLWNRGRRHHERVPRLVLEAFVGPCPRGKEACHNNGKPSDNTPRNLRWDTRANNMADCVEHGTDQRGERHSQAKLTRAEVERIYKWRTAGLTCQQIAERLRSRVSVALIAGILRGDRWRHMPGRPQRQWIRARGERSGQARLRADDVGRIHAMRAAGLSAKKIRRRLDVKVGQTTIWHVLNGETWAHLHPDPNIRVS